MAEPNNNQMAFWEAMREKYERRNESLKHQEECLKKRLEQLKLIMEKQKVGDDCDCVPQKLEKPSLVQCLMEKGRNLILGSCKCVDPKVGEKFLCACNEDPNTPLNVDPNLCPKQETKPPEGCLNPTCDFYDPNLAHLAENPSTFSLKTTDIYYMDKLADLVKSEKLMQEKIEDLEKREHSYLAAIHDLQESMKKQPKSEAMNREFKKMTEGLEEENKKLRNELEDLRLELKHCFERVEGPLKRSLQDQKNKCVNLENELKELENRAKIKETSYLKEINEVKAKLCKACCTMVDLNNVNSKLKSDLQSLQDKCNELEDELLKQKLKEAENILKFKKVLKKRCPKDREKTGQDLGKISNKLGDTMKNVCPGISEVPSGLAETVENIRQLTELVAEKGAQHRKKKYVNPQPVVANSQPRPIEKVHPTISDTPQRMKDTDSCACSNSSLRLKPKIGKGDFNGRKMANSSSATLASIPVMNVGVSKYTSTPRSSNKKTSSKSCTCCPVAKDCDKIEEDSIETLCRCSDVDNKKIGPSEEVIAVKNLGTLSIPPEVRVAPNVASSTFAKSQREKLAVDTTVDVLDVPPKDIQIVTTIAKTGSLEITTEGPPGIVHTKVNYLPDGKIEIVTKLVDRKHMDDFLDGTLLRIRENAPDCDESTACEGQCEPKDVSGCPEVECDNSKTCGVCSEEPEDSKEETGKGVSDQTAQEDSPYGQVVVVNHVSQLECESSKFFSAKEWKNSSFDKEPIEECFGDLKVASKNKRQGEIHEDVLSQAELLRLSHRKSLMDVEKSMEEESLGITSDGNLLNVLDTISEESSIDDFILLNNTVCDKKEVLDEKELLSESSKHSSMDSQELQDEASSTTSAETPVHRDELDFLCEVEKEPDVSRMDIEEPELEDSQLFGNLFNEIQVNVNPSDGDVQKRDVLEELPPKKIEDLGNSIVNERCKEEVVVSPVEVLEESSSLESKSLVLSQKRNDGSPDAFTETTKPFYRLCGHLNVPKIRITLKRSRSMYEKKSGLTEYLRFSKSTTLYLGSLKKDMERLKLSREQNVGYFEGMLSQDKPNFSPISLRGVERCRNENSKPLEILDKGYNSFGAFEPDVERSYQCYVCCCSNKKENNGQNPDKDRDLEHRIDRLLEMNPLASNHRPDISKSNSREKNNCRCSRKKLNKPDQVEDELENIKEKTSSRNEDNEKTHDENCSCVDCICNPCNFLLYRDKKRQNENLRIELGKTQGMKSRLPCDCDASCLCNPCMDKDKKLDPKGSQIKSRKTPCKKCSSKDLQEVKLEPKVEFEEEAARSIIPDTWKNVVGRSNFSNSDSKTQICGCNLCKGLEEETADEKNVEVGDLIKESPVGEIEDRMTCNCQLCECLFCSDERFRTGYEDVSKQNTADDVKTCACQPNCVCSPCPMSKNEETVEIKMATCGCGLKCLCEPCPTEGSEPTRLTEDAKNVEAVSQGVQVKTCSCLPECSCEPCQLLVEKVGDEVPNKCDCRKCDCEICFQSHSTAHEAIEDFLEKSRRKEEYEAMNFNKRVSCDCGTCECEICGVKEEKSAIEKKNAGDNAGGKREALEKCPCAEALTNDPLASCSECSICESEERKKIEIGKGEEVASEKMACDCCACDPCPDEVKKGKASPIGDADRAKEEIKNVLEKIGCSCDEAEVNLKPLVKRASSFENTVCQMKTKLHNLQQKCKDKDQIIDAMTRDLRMRSKSGIFADLLHDLSHPKRRCIPDFTRTYVCDALPKPRNVICGRLQPKRSSVCRFYNKLEPILELDRYLPGSKEGCFCPRIFEVTGLEIVDIRRVTIDSILMKWRPPRMHGVTGYQVFVNDQLKYRVLSPNRTSAVIDSLDLSRSLEITLYATTYCGRCEPPALATYKI